MNWWAIATVAALFAAPVIYREAKWRLEWRKHHHWLRGYTTGVKHRSSRRHR